MTALTLIGHPLSSFCWKVEIALREKGLAYENRLADLGDADFRAAFTKLWPTGRIPLLLVDGVPVPETSIQIETLDQLCPSPPLLPADTEVRRRVRLWDRLFDCYVMAPMQAYVAGHFPGTTPDTALLARHAATLDMAYTMIEERLTPAPYAAGGQFSMADCAAAPALFYARCCHPFGDRPALTRYYQALVGRPSVAASIDAAGPWFEHFPLASRLPGPRNLPAAL